MDTAADIVVITTCTVFLVDWLILKLRVRKCEEEFEWYCPRCKTTIPAERDTAKGG
jgi:hypothetical protein